MSSSAVSKKRKRGAEDAEKVTLQLSSQPTSQVGPVLASFPSLQPPKSTAFKCYVQRNRDKNASFETQPTLVAGEGETVEFFSADGPLQSTGCSYMIGVHDKRTNTTVLRPAPLHVLARQVKALKNLNPIEVSAGERMAQRNNLGEAFGTKKAKAAIRARERNRVDIDAMKDVAGHLQDTIMANTDTLPTAEEAKATADSNRLIPPYNEDAQRPHDVYALHDIIPEAEFNAIPVNAFKNANDMQDCYALLPWSRSDWIKLQLRFIYSAPKPDKRELKTVYYVSAMIAFYKNSRIVGDKDALQHKLASVPSIILDGLISRFTEKERSTNKPKMTPQTETMLLTYMFALCLRVDDYATDTETIAHDLSMPPAKVSGLFKALGCTIKKLSPTELKERGLPDAAAETKRAVLKIPLEFPKSRVKRARR
ncbi:RNA polymerase I associated factor, A49-like protein [Dichomitus squalens LYAD-421 SS1]|uniref:RNA polymerase I associated factor, A49-like protein n=2 Tax=Dichomitus squalens TaxID=114155 RepID=A0A4Q9PLW6_9APHY|nr:RNA polymerase I associated factor, A49-like protein [Dichomitus squalens LYAD-421 SS1]EJF57477.1 RNA polymerase I associated factor, A49-like protein [Dichomitus squalens LYAD-421 SS1]TBU55144.1 RNA polymerase I associated factor, A49-like protein [Dichomitus squalens]